MQIQVKAFLHCLKYFHTTLYYVNLFIYTDDIKQQHKSRIIRSAAKVHSKELTPAAYIDFILRPCAS